MALPEFDERGDLPAGLHPASLAEVAQRFGQSNDARRELLKMLETIFQRAKATGKLLRFVVFGSFITATTEPRDIDVVMVMQDDFSMAACGEETRILRSEEHTSVLN